MHREGAKTVLWTICVILLVLWALGLATSYTAGGLIHVLLVVAVLVMVFRLIQGRRIV
jgi:asparagine N-glycosylation enzyme membrane subunit Stt3